MNGEILKKIYDITFEAYQRKSYLRHDDIGGGVYFYFNGAEYLNVYIEKKDEKIFEICFYGIERSLKFKTDIYLKQNVLIINLLLKKNIPMKNWKNII